LDDALALLRLQIEWGADEALEQEPLDRLRQVAAAEPAPRPRIPAAVAIQTADQPRLTPAHQAVALAGRAETLDALRENLASFDGCALRDTASNLIFAEGDPSSTTLIIGEPPGREEDRGGHPFAGPDGVLLDQMLASIGLDRRQLMLTPLLPWRPPGGRPPNAAEIALCLPFLHRLIMIVNPRRLVLFGGTAARALISPSRTRRRQDPEWVDCRIPGLQNPLPSLTLPSLAEMQKTLPLRRLAWIGLRLLKRAIEAETTRM